jgi:transcriptional regulator with XRE-family HTH domain
MTETDDLERAAARAAVDAVAMMNRARETVGVPQRELADRLGVGESRVSQILNGDGNVRMATLGRVLHALGYRLTLVVEPVGDDTPMIPRRPGRRRGRRAPEVRSWGREIVFDGVSDTVPPEWSTADFEVTGVE